MTDDTNRALEAIRPIATVLGISVAADDNFLYLNGQAIGIGCNSAWATVNEFIGYAFLKVWMKDKYMYCDMELRDRIKRYWFTDKQLEMILDGQKHG